MIGAGARAADGGDRATRCWRQRLAQSYIETEIVRLVAYRQVSELMRTRAARPGGLVPEAALERDRHAHEGRSAIELEGPYARVERGDPHAVDGGRWQYEYLWSRAASASTPAPPRCSATSSRSACWAFRAASDPRPLVVRESGACRGRGTLGLRDELVHGVVRARSTAGSRSSWPDRPRTSHRVRAGVARRRSPATARRACSRRRPYRPSRRSCPPAPPPTTRRCSNPCS